MAFALKFDGVNDRVTFTSVTLSLDFIIHLKFKFESNASNQALIGQSFGTVNAIRLNTDESILVKIDNTGHTLTWLSSLVDGNVYEIKVVRTGSTVDVTDENDVSVVTSTATESGALTFNQMGMLVTTSVPFNGEWWFLNVDDNGTDELNYPMNEGTGSTLFDAVMPINNGTLVSFPTNDSQWINLDSGVTVTALLNSNYMVEYSMKKNVASQSIGAQMVTISDGSDFTGTVTAEVTIDNGTKAAGGGTVTHEGEGYHSYAPTQAETNGDHIAVSFAGTGALTQTIQVYTTFPQTVDNDTKISLIPTTAMRGTDSASTASQVAALNNFNPASDTVANVTLVATTTTNTDMVGTDNALLAASYTAPDNASITSILVDTNELQLNQGDWLTATGFSTLVATDIVTGGAITTSSGDASVDINKINGVTITGDGSANPFDV